MIKVYFINSIFNKKTSNVNSKIKLKFTLNVSDEDFTDWVEGKGGDFIDSLYEIYGYHEFIGSCFDDKLNIEIWTVDIEEDDIEDWKGLKKEYEKEFKNKGWL